MTATTRSYNWPTREKWAKGRHAFYRDRFDDLEICFSISQAEKEPIIQALEAFWKNEGRRMRALQLPKELNQPRGEPRRDYWSRRNALPPAEMELLAGYEKCRRDRYFVREAIRDIRRGEWLPHRSDVHYVKDPTVTELFAPLRARYRAAREAAEEKRRQEILSNPIDDAAWQRELQWRYKIEHRA